MKYVSHKIRILTNQSNSITTTKINTIIYSTMSSLLLQKKAANKGNSSPKKGVSPMKLKKAYSPITAYKPRIMVFGKEQLKPLTFGNGMVWMTATKTFENNKKIAGYLKPVTDICMNGTDDVDGITSPEKGNVRCSNYLFLRMDHEHNEKVGNGRAPKLGITYNWTGIMLYPNADHYGENNDDGEKILTIESEKKVTGDIKRLLCEKLRKKAANTYTPWKDSDSTTDFDNMASMDTSLTDESVGHVLQAYVLPDEMEYSDVYAYLKENDLEYFFSRKSSNGRFNKFPIDNFGYPSNVEMDKSNKFW